MEFETKVDVEMPYEQGVSYRGDATIKWSVEFEIRERGIKDIVINIPDQKIELTKITETESEDIEEGVEFEVTNAIESIPEGLRSSIIPVCLELYDGKWVLIF